MNEDFSAYDHISTDEIWDILDDWSVMLKEDPKSAMYCAQSAYFFQNLIQYRRTQQEAKA